ncbi:hypothetical protein TrRE_jg3213, partial [Triparma retinervis]
MKNRNKLEEIRAKIKVFDKDQTVKSRRMKMKKLAAGGLNTLVKDASVILDVVSLVKEGIASSRSSDSSSPPGSAGSVGTPYLLDLLASSVGKRVGAESYSVKNVDGYPLGAVARGLMEVEGWGEAMDAHGE